MLLTTAHPMTDVTSKLAGPFAGVMQVYAGNRYGGVESMLSVMARSPAFAGQCYALFHRGRLFKELEAAGADVVDIGPFRTRFPWQVWTLRRKLKRALDERSIHTVVGNMPIAYALAAPVAKSRLLVFFAHEPHQGTHWTERWAKLCRQPDIVVTGSQCVADTTHTIFPDVDSFVVHYAAQLGSPGTAENRRAVREELGTPTSHKVIVCAARFVPYKGHHMFIQALGQLRARTDWTAWFAGGPQTPFESSYFEQLKGSARSLGLEGRLKFLGERRDVGRLLRAADAFCQANVEPDAFGICFAEALDAGIPVITSAIGGALEIVTPELGELVPPRDAHALARALAATMDDERKAAFTRENGPIRARQVCDPEKVAANFQRAFALARERNVHARRPTGARKQPPARQAGTLV